MICAASAYFQNRIIMFWPPTNWERGHAVSSLGINVSNFRYSVYICLGNEERNWQQRTTTLKYLHLHENIESIYLENIANIAVLSYELSALLELVPRLFHPYFLGRKCICWKLRS